VLTLEDWELLTFRLVDATNWWASLYLLAWVLIGHYILLTLFLAVILEGFEGMYDHNTGADLVVARLGGRASWAPYSTPDSRATRRARTQSIDPAQPSASALSPKHTNKARPNNQGCPRPATDKTATLTGSYPSSYIATVASLSSFSSAAAGKITATPRRHVRGAEEGENCARSAHGEPLAEAVTKRHEHESATECPAQCGLRLMSPDMHDSSGQMIWYEREESTSVMGSLETSRHLEGEKSVSYDPDGFEWTANWQRWVMESDAPCDAENVLCPWQPSIHAHLGDATVGLQYAGIREVTREKGVLTQSLKEPRAYVRGT
jgi:hypothetical protein